MPRMLAMTALTLQPWVVTEGSGGGTDAFTDLALTSAGQILVAGHGGLAGSAAGGSDLHVSLRDLRGRVIWQWNGGSSGDDAFLAVLPLSNGALAAGYRAGSGGQRDAYVAQFDTAGDLKANQILASSTASDDQFNDLALGTGGQVVLVGVSRGDGSIGGQTKANPAASGTDPGRGDGLLTIFSGGSSITRLVGGSGDDGLEAVAVVPSGSAAGTILVAGYQTIPATGDLQAYLAAYDTAGVRRWEQFLGAAGVADRLTALVCDASAVYVAGTTRGLLPGGGATRSDSRTDADPFLAAFDLSGRLLWTRQLDESPLDTRTAELTLAGNRLELISGDASGISRFSFSSAGQLLGGGPLLSAAGSTLEAALVTSAGQVLLAGSSSDAWPERPAGGPPDALLHLSGPVLSAYQLDIQPFDAQGQPSSIGFSLNPGAGLKFTAGSYSGLTGRLSVDGTGAATYTPYPELAELYGWTTSLQDVIQLNLTDLAGQTPSSQELVLRLAPAPAQTPLQRFTLNANQVSGRVRPLGLGRPELRLRLSDTTYTTSLGASRALSAFNGPSADVTLRLAVDRAPLTALNALRYAREQVYDQTIFHRVIDGFMVQGGGFSASRRTATGFGSASSFGPIPLEGTQTSGLVNVRGSLAMARTSNPHSASNQFFVNVVNNGFLDATAGTASDGSGNPGYAVFGAVASGLEVFDAIAKAPLRKGASGGNDSSWGSPFEDITEPVVVIEQARLTAIPDGLQYALASAPAFGQVSVDPLSGAFVYIPAAGFSGTDSFEVRSTSAALPGLPERSVLQRISVSGELGRAVYSLAPQPAGSRLRISDAALQRVEVTSDGAPDWIEAEAPVSLTLEARSSTVWGEGFSALNVGSPGSLGTGERLSLKGLARYAFVANAIPAATTTIVLEPERDSAFFLHDAHSAFQADLSLSPDSSGRASARRLLEVDTIRMGSGGGTSIVDLTSPDYAGGAMTVHGAARGVSVFWGTAADDTFRSGGGDAVIFGGAGRNRHELAAGRETLQLRAGGNADDVVVGFDPGRDRLQLWLGPDQVAIEPLFTAGPTSTLVSWAGNRLEFLGLTDLSLSNLVISSATANL